MPKSSAGSLLVAHDAGGASLLKELFLPKKENVVAYASGPARQILADFENLYGRRPLHSLIINSQQVWCGTGWSSDLEISTFRICALTRTPVTAVVDSPYNFEERFRGIDIPSFPATVLVSELFINELDFGSLEEIARSRLRVIEDPMVKRGESIRSKRLDMEKRALFLTQPLRQFGTIGSVDFFRRAIEKIRGLVPFDNLVVRIHPADTTFLDRAMSLSKELHFELSSRIDFVEDIAVSDLVLGVNSHGLRIAAALGIETYSCRSKLSEDSLLAPPVGAKVFDIDLGIFRS